MNSKKNVASSHDLKIAVLIATAWALTEIGRFLKNKLNKKRLLVEKNKTEINNSVSNIEINIKQQLNVSYGYNENGYDYAGNDRLYYGREFEKINNDIKHAKKEFKKQNIVDGVISLRTSLEYLLHILIIHRTGQTTKGKYRLKWNIKICEEYKLLDEETIDWLREASNKIGTYIHKHVKERKLKIDDTDELLYGVMDCFNIIKGILQCDNIESISE